MLEAFAMARPVVCSRVGAVTEVVDSSNGILVDAGAGEGGRFAAAVQRRLLHAGTLATRWVRPAAVKWRLSTTYEKLARHMAKPLFVSANLRW